MRIIENIEEDNVEECWKGDMYKVGLEHVTGRQCHCCCETKALRTVGRLRLKFILM
jgi:hypothetical protein